MWRWREGAREQLDFGLGADSWVSSLDLGTVEGLSS